MTQLDVSVVRRKLALIQQALLALETVRALTLEQYQSDLFRKKAIERFLQEAIEAAIDCSSHLVVRAGKPAPADLYSSFLALADLGVIDRALATALAPSAGLRNRLVHEYDTLDDTKVHAAVGTACDQLGQFIAAVEKYVAAQVP